MPEHRPCFTRFRASRSSHAPMRWATITEKPTTSARHNPPNSHVLEATRPMEAEASRPNCPTMEASMYCITMEEIWARMAGILSCSVSLVCCRRVRVCPSRSDRSRFCLAI